MDDICSNWSTAHNTSRKNYLKTMKKENNTFYYCITKKGNAQPDKSME